MKPNAKFCAALVLATFSFAASAAAPWSDTPVTCHWIGAEYAGRYAGYDYAEWTNSANWAEGVVPGRFESGGAVVGCEGCTAVFDRACDYSTIGISGLYSISNIVVSGSSTPEIRIGHSSGTSAPKLYFERGGGISVANDVVKAPLLNPRFLYRRGDGSTTTFYFENNSATPLNLSGFGGSDPSFSSWAGSMVLVMSGTGTINGNGTYDRTKVGIKIELCMNGGKFVQAYTGGSSVVDYISIPSNVNKQHFEISNGATVRLPEYAMPLVAQSDLLIDGEGTLNFDAAADKSAVIGVKSGKTLTLDCNIVRKDGGSFQIGHGSYNGGTVELAAGRSFNAPVKFYNGILQLADGETFTSALSIMDDIASRRGTISGGREIEAKITGGVAGVGHALTLTNRLAIASDIAATTTVAADAEISFRKADEAATTSFTVSSLTLLGNKTIPVEDGVTATVTAINNNGYTLDIRPSGTSKVLFTGLSAGRAPEWLTLNGSRAKIAADGELIPPGGMLLIYR